MRLFSTKDHLRLLAGLLALQVSAAMIGQTTIFHQGFESAIPCNNWGYTGGIVNTESRRTGINSARIGRSGESNMITFNTVNVTGLSGLQLRFHHAVRSGMGPGMDTDEGAVVQVQINGGAWTTIQTVSGYGDATWTWINVTGGNPSNGCLLTMPNPVSHSPAAGTNTLAFRIFTTLGSCPSGSSSASTYNRTDEGLFIDDVTLTTTTTPLPFIWSGTVDTDWHKCNNWRYGVVPGLTNDVTIDGTAVNDCEVYTANAQCASLSLSANSATVRNLTIRTGRQLNVTNAVTVLRTGAGSPVGITLGTSGTGTLSCGSLTLDGSAATNKTAYLRNEVGTNGLLVRGDLTIETGGHLDLEGAAAGGILQLQGDLINNDGEAAFDEQFSLVWFSGTVPQSINTTGFQERFGSIRMGKTAESLTLNAAIGVRAALLFTYVAPGGRIFSNSALPDRLLTMESTATTANASDGSHVDGPVRRNGTANFIFPIGKIGVYRPAQITNIAGIVTDAFTAEYQNASARTTFTPFVEPTLNHVSDCEYWTIERANGTPNARVTLSWHNALSCGVSVPSELRVAWFDATGPIWRDRGNNGATNTAWGGWVPSGAVETQFGAWTLASTTNNNPLPIELISFDATSEEAIVRCTWVTAMERDNDHFVVERSSYELDFTAIGHVLSAGNGWSLRTYNWIDDAPLDGLSYYRLRQVDLDGTTTLSDVVPVVRRRKGSAPTVLQFSDHVEILHDMPVGSLFTLYDAAGRMCEQGRIESDRIILRRSRAFGAQLLVLMNGDHVDRIRFVQ